MSVLTLQVNEVMRTISNDGRYPFVVKDKTVDIVRFALNTGFTDIALDEHSALRAMYQRPGETEVRAKTLTYYDTDGLHNYYDWQLLSADLAEKGTLTVALCILRTDSEVEEWHTTPCQIRVLDTIHTDDSDEADETITPTVAQRVAVLETMIQRVASGAPIVVANASAMTDTDQIYVLSTDGNWYYHNGTAWTVGGEYGAVATDTTLTQSGIPADAEAVGDKITPIENDLAELESTAKIQVETEDSTMHDIGYVANVSSISFHPSADSFEPYKYADKLHVKYGKTAQYESDGVTFKLENDTITLNGTCGGTNKIKWLGTQSCDLSGLYKLFLVTSGNVAMQFRVRRYIGSTTTDTRLSTTDGTSGKYSADIDMSDATGFEIALATLTDKGTYDNTKIWFGLFPADVVIADLPFNGMQTRYIDTLMCPSSITYTASTKEYVDNAVPKGMITEELLTYLSPEMEVYGAKGDGVEDDTIALQNCIDDAISRSKPIRAYGKYRTTSPIKIIGNNLNIYINQILAGGTDAALIVTGNRNTIGMNVLSSYSGNGTAGLRLTTETTTDGAKNCRGNRIEIDRVSANGNAVEIINTSASAVVYYNKFNFMYLLSSTANAIYTNILNDNENTFYGKDVNCQNGWFLYQEKGGRRSNKFFNFGLEAAVKNGIYGNGTFSHFRTLELMDTYTGEGSERGILFKAPVMGADSEFLDTFVNYDSVDVSQCRNLAECISYTESVAADYSTIAKAYWYAFKQYYTANRCLSKIYRFSNIPEGQGEGYAQEGEIYTYFNHKVFRPKEPIIREVTETTYTPYTDDQLMPTIFDVGVNTEISLNDSYCCIGINEFLVKQYNGKKAIIKDKSQNVIFDGTSKDAGVYRIRAIIKPKILSITRPDGSIYTTTEPFTYYGDNEEWFVEKINAI